MTATACPACEGHGEVRSSIDDTELCPDCAGTGLLSQDDGSSPAGSHIERRT